MSIHDYKGEKEFGHDLSPNSFQLFYIGSEIAACGICILAKITHDLFVELNRD